MLSLLRYFISLTSLQILMTSYSLNHIYAGEMSITDLSNLLSEQKITSIEQLLAKLPPSFLKNYTLQFKGNGLQGASEQSPRVFLFGETGKFVMTLNGGDPLHGKSDHVEVLTYNDNAEAFELFNIDFSKSKINNVPPRPEKNPRECLACHQATNGRIKPFFTPYSKWPGFYGGMNDAIDSNTIESFRQFNKNRIHHPRYRYLQFHEELSEDQMPRKWAPYDGNEYKSYQVRPNLRLMDHLYWLNSRSISIAISKHKQYPKLLPFLGLLYSPLKSFNSKNYIELKKHSFSIEFLKDAKCDEELVFQYQIYLNRIHDLLGTPTDDTHKRSILEIAQIFNLLNISESEVLMNTNLVPKLGTQLFYLSFEIGESGFLVNGKIVKDFYRASQKIFGEERSPFKLIPLSLNYIAKPLIRNEFDKKFVNYLDSIEMLYNIDFQDSSKVNRNEIACDFYQAIDKMLKVNFK